MAVPKDLQSYFAGANMQRRVYQERRGSRFLSGLIGFGRSALGGFVDLATSAFNHHLAEKSAQSQYNRQLDFWRMQNEYNTPLAQRKRLEDAGLNPAVLAGDIAGQNTAGGLSSVPGNEVAQRGAIDHSSFLNSLQLLAQMESVGAGTDNMKRQIELSYAEELIKNGEAYGIQLDNREKNILLNWLNRDKRAALENLLTDTDSKRAGIANTEASTAGLLIDNENKQRSYDDQHEESDSRTSLNVAQAKSISSKLEHEIQLLKDQSFLAFESAGNAHMQQKLNEYEFNIQSAFRHIKEIAELYNLESSYLLDLSRISDLDSQDFYRYINATLVATQQEVDLIINDSRIASSEKLAGLSNFRQLLTSAIDAFPSNKPKPTKKSKK